jgi:uncharacterized protein
MTRPPSASPPPPPHPTRGGDPMGRPPTPVTVAEALLLTAWLVVGQLLFGGIAVALGITDFSGDAAGRIVLVAVQAAVLATVLAWLAARGNLTTVAVPRRPPRAGDLGLGVGVGIGAFATLVLVLGTAMRLLGDVEPPRQQALDDAAAGGVDALLAVVLAVLLAPILEEVVFRGALHGALRDRVGVWPAAALSSGVFALIHLEIVASSPPFLVQLFVLGLVFVWLYERTGNLVAPTVAHLVFNAISISLVYLVPQLEEHVEELVGAGLAAVPFAWAAQGAIGFVPFG